MVRNSKVTGKAFSLPVGLIVGLVISMVITVSCSLAIAMMVIGGCMDVSAIGGWALAIVLVSAMVGALIAQLVVKRRTMMVCLLEGGLYFASLLIANALFFGGTYEGVWTVLISILLGVSAVAAVLARSSKAKGTRFKKRRYR